MSELTDASLYACLYQPPLPGTINQPPSAGFDASTSRPTTNDPRPTTDDQRPTTTGRPTTNDQRPTINDQRPTTRPTTNDQRLTTIAAEFSPRYEQHRPDLVSVDVRGLSRLLGTPKMIGAEMRRESAARGVRVHVAIAPTRMAAIVLATATPGLTVVPAGGIAEALAPIPLSVLEQLHEQPQPGGVSATQARLRADEARAAIAALKRWGLRTLGELAALQPADLSARLGRGGRLWQAIARGEDIRPLVPMQAEERFEGTLELDWPIDGAEPLSFVLTRLLEPLSTRLERRDRGAAVLHVALGLVTREVHVCRLELPSPLRDVRALRTLALLDFESHPPAAAIDKVTVTLEPTPGRILQHALFARPHPTPEQLSTLLARLGALMGQDRIGSPSLVDTHRPGAFVMVPFAMEHPAAPAWQGAADPPAGAPGPAGADSRLPASALRRCRQPVPARVSMDAHLRPLRVSTDRRGFGGGAVLASAGPWRTSGAWWEEDTGERQKSEGRSQKSEVRSGATHGGGTGPWTRDEWDVALADGAVYRIFRNRATDGWFIDGVLD